RLRSDKDLYASRLSSAPAPHGRSDWVRRLCLARQRVARQDRPPDASERHRLRMRHGAAGRSAAAFQREVLPRGDALHPVRPGDCVYVSVGGRLQRDDRESKLVLWSMLSFISILMVGYVYALEKGALDWKN